MNPVSFQIHRSGILYFNSMCCLNMFEYFSLCYLCSATRLTLGGPLASLEKEPEHLCNDPCAGASQCHPNTEHGGTPKHLKVSKNV